MAVVKFIPLAEEDENAWSRFVDVCDSAWLYHRPEYIRLDQLEKADTDCSFSIRDDSGIVGVCVLAKYKVGLGAVLSGPGLAVDRKHRTRELLTLAKAKIEDVATKSSCQAVRFSLSPLTPEMHGHRYHESILADWGFSFGQRGNSLDYEAAFGTVIDLRKDLSVILGGFSKGHRADVTRCRKLGLAVSVNQGPSLSQNRWDEFVQIHRSTFTRNGLTPFSAARLEYLSGMVSRSLLALATTYEKETPIASILLETYKSGLYYLAGGSTAQGLKIKANAFTQYSVMEWAKAAGYRHYLIGMTAPVDRNTKGGRIGAFKTHFGGEKWDHLAGELVLDRQAHARKIILPAVLGLSGFKPKIVGSVARRVRRLLRKKKLPPTK
jgi:hypothetical protein